MTPDETLKQLMDAIQVKCGDGYLDALHALLGLFSLHEEGKGMPHGLPYTAAKALLDAAKEAYSGMRGKASLLDMLGAADDSADLDYDADLLRDAIASATPPVEQGE